MIVYCATHRKSGRKYVGQTQNESFDRRFRAHLRSRYYFGNALRRYGVSAFTFEIIDRARTPKELSQKERRWIKKLDTMVPNGYNLTSGGEKREGFVWSARTNKLRARRSYGALAYWLATHPNPMLGKKRPDLAARNRAGVGRKASAETRAKMSAWHKANPPSPEHRAAINRALRQRARAA